MQRPAYPRLLATGMMYTVTLRQHSIASDSITPASHGRWSRRRVTVAGRNASGSASVTVRVFAWLVTRRYTVTRDRAGVALRLLTEAKPAIMMTAYWYSSWQHWHPSPRSQ
jgi:hypothetical protein